MATERVTIDISKWNEFVGKLIEQTCEGKIEWKTSRWAERSNAEGSVFVGAIKGKKTETYVAVYEYTFPYYHDDVDSPEIRTDVAIELVHDEEGRNLNWRLPQVPKRHELLGLVKYANSKASNVLEDFLASD